GPEPDPRQVSERLVQIQSDVAFQTQLRELSLEKSKFAAQFAPSPALTPQAHLNLIAAVIENCVQLATECWRRRDPTTAFQALAAGFQARARSPLASGRSCQSPDFRLKWIQVTPDHETYGFGDTVFVTIDWQLEEQNPELSLITRLLLLNEYGQVVTQTESNPTVPMSKWLPGQSSRQQIYFRIPTPSSAQSVPPTVKSEIFTGWHEIALAVFAPPNAKHPHPQPIWLDHPEKIKFFPIGTGYTVNRIWVSAAKIQIQKLTLPPITVGMLAPIKLEIKNGDPATQELTTLIQIKTETGGIIFQDGRVSRFPGRQSTIQEFNWLADYAGNLKCEVRVCQEHQVLTQTVSAWSIAWPPSYQIELQRGHSVQKTAMNFYVPLELRCQHPLGLETPATLEVEIRGGEKALIQSSFPLSKTQATEKFHLNPEPYWGDYLVHGTFKTPDQTFHFAQPIVATVVEIVNQTLVVNGEPFLIKGIDVQGLYPNSRSKTEQVLQFLKANGFNTLAGEAPPLWQVELAQQHHLVWLVAPDFHLPANAPELFSVTADTAGVRQELSRQQVLAYANQAGILGWDLGLLSAAAQTVNLAPVYHLYDRYRRPVTGTFANAEVCGPGLDLLGVRAFFRPGQSTFSQQPLLLNSLRRAMQRNLPVMVSAYNLAGAEGEQSAARVVSQMWRENLNRGLAGSIFYPLEDEPERFTGLLDGAGNLNLRPRLSEAFQIHHADITLAAEKRNADTLFVRLTNQRPFTIRHMEITVKMRAGSTTYRIAAEIPPLESMTTILPIPTDLLAQAIILSGQVTFETHFGLKNQVSFQLFYPR
ncbi:hypothetical protein L0128_22330, partial [candidate division KSB1 bacterium]|nr:hypothetical protein [candidate division KSB1 bacterium]